MKFSSEFLVVLLVCLVVGSSANLVKKKRTKRPGRCPAPTGFGICVKECNDDFDCPRSQKCCSNGCGQVCMEAVRTIKPKKPKKNKIPPCPVPNGVGNCDINCKKDKECDCITHRCCFNGCGYQCVNVKKKRCMYNGETYKAGECFPKDCNTCTCQKDGSVTCTEKACGCTFNGETYAVGDTFPSDCNNCTCMEDGNVACTKIFCGCSFNGETYAVGDTFPSDCNNCTCMEDGNVACTKIFCAPCEYKGVVYPSGTYFQDECNNCTCSDGLVTCPDRDCPVTCDNGLLPIEEKCGGFAGFVCPDGSTCDMSNMKPGQADFFGQCCKEYQCPNGLDPLSFTNCERGSLCPNGYTCETLKSGRDIARLCCLDCSTIDCKETVCKDSYVPKGKCCAVCPGCTVDGRTYKIGESFPQDCNTCFCQEDGDIACTEIACAPCEVNGVFYPSGTSFKDKCNTCRCSNGAAACTRIGCVDTCPFGLRPLEQDCGGPKDPKCPKNFECFPPPLSGVLVISTGNKGKCCEVFQCPNGRKPLTFTSCSNDDKHVCPNRFICYVPEGRKPPVGVCCPDCSFVKCAKPPCKNSFYPEGKCCAICPGCTVNGQTYKTGETFPQDCNTCVCLENGDISCTRKLCAPCTVNGVVYPSGTSFKDKCNTCQCSNGVAACTKIGCDDTCPFGLRPLEQDCGGPKDPKCPEDFECFPPPLSLISTGTKGKCCEVFKCPNGRTPLTSTSCSKTNNLVCPNGFICVEKEERKIPIGVCCPDCSSVKCGRPACENFFFPEGQCCPECPVCLAVLCPPVRCQNSYIPPGECCPRCGPDCSLQLCKALQCKLKYKPPGECCPRCVPDCNLAWCPPLKCNTFKPPDQCCPQCIPTDSCYLNGETYYIGQTFKVDCNTCTCTKGGNVLCTKKFCGSCEVDGYTYKSGTSFKVGCNTCQCSSGNVICTLIACANGCPHDLKPIDQICNGIQGSDCPKGYHCVPNPNGPIGGADISGICCEKLTCLNGDDPVPFTTCSQENSLGCPNGYTCEPQEQRKDVTGICCPAAPVDCKLVKCEPPACENAYKPKGQCCTKCPDCSAVSCLAELKCQNQFIPPGECCPHCGEDCSKIFCAVPDCEFRYRPPGKCCQICVPDCNQVYCPRLKCKSFIPQGECCPRCLQDCSTVKCKKPECDNPYRPDGECCEVCPESGTCNISGTIYKNGESFYQDCNICGCNNGFALCTLRACPPGCYQNGTQYLDGAKVPNDDPCLDCDCRLGKDGFEIRCFKRGCPAPECDEPVKSDDECCPRCEEPGCYRDGKRYDKDAVVDTGNPCEHCTCFQTDKGYEIICAVIDCPYWDCPNPLYIEGRCCPVCKDCEVDGKFYKIGSDIPDDDPCTFCSCQKGDDGRGRSECAIMGCALPECDYPEKVVRLEGMCCPVCLSPEEYCEVGGKFYKIGADIPNNNPCKFCTCAEGYEGHGGEEICALVSCGYPVCVYPYELVQEEGKCCPECRLRPQACHYGSLTINPGTTVDIKCCKCRCLNNELDWECPPVNCDCPKGDEFPPRPPPPKCCGCPPL